MVQKFTNTKHVPIKAYCILRKMRKLRFGCVKSCARFAQDCTYFSNTQYIRKICTRLYLFPQCAIYVQDLCKIVLISPMHNICPRFAQDCTYFLNAQYMHKICARLYLLLQCAIYAQDLRKIVLISPMSNICVRFVQDCTFFSNAQYMHKICARLYLTSNLKW